jgi:hypothetical protein
MNKKRYVKRKQAEIRLPRRQQDGARGQHGIDGPDAESVI